MGDIASLSMSSAAPTLRMKFISDESIAFGFNHSLPVETEPNRDRVIKKIPILQPFCAIFPFSTPDARAKPANPYDAGWAD
jgi:hypothetical protein